MVKSFVALLAAALLPVNAWAQAIAVPVLPNIYNHDPASFIGPLHWGEVAFPTNATCGATFSRNPMVLFQQVGKKQSPIDIAAGAAIAAPLPPLQLAYQGIGAGTPTPFEIETNDHAIEVPYHAPEGAPASTLQVGDDHYELLQFHFHAHSEHAFDGMLEEAELHLVHRNAVGDLAVVGVLLDTNLPPVEAIESVVHAALLHQGAVEGEGTFNAADMLPAYKGYYTYSGSLTTPPCSEGVRWLVLKDKVGISPEAAAKLHEVVRNFVSNNPPFAPGAFAFGNNNRPVQSLNGRAVLASP